MRSCFAAVILSLVASGACASVLISVDKNAQAGCQFLLTVCRATTLLYRPAEPDSVPPTARISPNAWSGRGLRRNIIILPCRIRSSSMAATRSMVATKSAGSADQPRTAASGYIPRTPPLCSRWRSSRVPGPQRSWCPDKVRQLPDGATSTSDL